MSGLVVISDSGPLAHVDSSERLITIVAAMGANHDILTRGEGGGAMPSVSTRGSVLKSPQRCRKPLSGAEFDSPQLLGGGGLAASNENA